MRLIPTIIFCAVIATTCAGPDPKKYKTDLKEKDKKSNTTLTEEERKFLREVEAKFGIKADADNSKDETESKNITNITNPFPAIIAIEIVNDTDSKSKGKRTIDANLGYGYKTNNGYSYSYFGKGAQEKGKFMIYPYSQQDIPTSSHHGGHYDHSGGRHTTGATKVEIQPSRAFELVQVNEEKNGHQYKTPTNGHRTNYNNIKGLVSPPPQYSQVDYSANQTPASHLSTLYTTYNGKGFSGLSGQFPTVMPNYLVDPSQLLKYPEYKSAGLTSDHLHNLQDTKTDHRVVPVLVLRIPSSSLKNPTAELFANLPENYPLSRYLNNVNLQELVNEYFKKMGYSHGPPVMAYQDSLTLKPAETTAASPASNYEPQQYAHPYVQPSYTHADYSGVQYSAVKPVMARYPSSYTRQQYYLPPGHSLYQQPMHQQKYDYRYQYVPQSGGQTQAYYVQPHYQQQPHQAHQAISQESGHDTALTHQSNVQDTSAEVEYGVPSHGTDQETTVTTYEYVHPQNQVQTHYEARTPSPEYGVVPEHSETESAEYDTSKVTAMVPVYGPPKEETEAQQQYATANEHAENDAAAAYEAQIQQTAQKYYSEGDSGESQGYVYQQPRQEDSAQNLVLTENYPSKDHTIATVLPTSYKSRQPTSGPVQTITYVTPMPYSYKYQSPYKVMIPQTYLKHPDSEKVSYVNSHSLSSSSHAQTALHYEQNPEAEYTLPAQYIPPVGKQKPPAYPRNYHSHPKRMVRPENKSENAVHAKKQNGRSEKMKSA